MVFWAVTKLSRWTKQFVPRPPGCPDARPLPITPLAEVWSVWQGFVVCQNAITYFSNGLYCSVC